MSIKVQVIFYSMNGHVYRIAEAVVEGAKQETGAEVSLYQVQELMPDDVLEKYSAKAAKASLAKIPVATVEQLPEADAIIFGTPNALRQYGCPDAQFPRPNWAVVDERSVDR
jgi:multimeric flavodoxin WrbA